MGHGSSFALKTRRAVSAGRGFGDGHRHFQFAVAADRYLARVAEKLARAVFPRAVEREFAAGVAGNTERLNAGAAEVVVQNPDGSVADDVLRTSDRKSGDRNSAGQRFE